MIDPAMRNMSPPEMLFRKEAVRSSVDFKVAKFCEKFRKIPSVTLLSVSARDCRRGKVFALVPLRAESAISRSARKRALFRLPPPLLPVALFFVAMIGVTSQLAVAADAPPSVAPNSADGAAVPGAHSPSPEAAPPSSGAAPAPLPAAPQPAAPAAATVDLTAPQPDASQKQPITSKWWFWTAIGAAVAGGLVALYLAERTPSPPGCPTAMGYVCPR
jgi:hypothetical protein